MKKFTKKQQRQEAQYTLPYHYFDLIGEEYKLLWSIEYVNNLKILVNLTGPFNGQLLLDVGCGDGRFCYELRDKNIKVIGVDFSESAIRFAKAFNPHCEFYTQNTKNLNIPHRFDCIVLIESLEHFVPKEIPDILENISNVLKKDGKIIFSVPSEKLALDKKHYQHFSEQSLRKTLSKHFKIVRVYGYSKTGLRRKIFTYLRSLGVLIFPFKNRLKFIRNYYIFLNNYYAKYLTTGKPEECTGIIAVCKKR